MGMIYAGQIGPFPPGTVLRDANGRQLDGVLGLDMLTGEVIDYRMFDWLWWVHPFWQLREGFWQWMEIRGVSVDHYMPVRHWFAPAPLRYEQLDAWE